MQKAKIHPIIADVGMILMDQSMRLVAVDRGAAAILNHQAQPGVKPDAASILPKDVLDALRTRKPTDLAPIKTHFRMGKNEYICRTYLVESHSAVFGESVMALHLEKVSSASDAIHDVGAKFGLTDREMEALRGISMGLTSKEVAERMNISPNTVKAFLRLIMIKMGVTTRGGIVANILNRATGEDRPEMGRPETMDQVPNGVPAAVNGPTPRGGGVPPSRPVARRTR